jgi:mono/diheme cytochrome c family protein
MFGMFLVAGCLLAQHESRTVWDGVYTREQAERGHAQYDRRCSGCHGDELEGDVVEHPELAGGNFRDKWNGQSLGELFERIHRDMPMKEPGSLSRATSADLLAFILSANNFPAGPQELPRDTPSLEQIKFKARR